MRRRIYQILNQPAEGDWLGRGIHVALLLLIAANVTANVVESDAEIAASGAAFFRTFEWVSVIVFTIEYLLRLWLAGEDPAFAGQPRPWLRLALTPMALIDLAAFAPAYITMVAPSAIDLRYLRVLRLLRLFRLLRIQRVSEAFATLVRVMQAKRVDLGVAIVFVAAAMFVAAGAIYFAERNELDTKFTSIPTSMWWAIITITTIGYGDMVPTSPLGQVIAGMVGFVGICALALPVGILSSGFIDEVNRRHHARTPRVCPHCKHELDEP